MDDPIAAPIVFHDEGCIVTAYPDGRIAVADLQERPLLELTGIKLCWNPVRTGSGWTFAAGKNAAVVRSYSVYVYLNDPRHSGGLNILFTDGHAAYRRGMYPRSEVVWKGFWTESLRDDG